MKIQSAPKWSSELQPLSLKKEWDKTYVTYYAFGVQAGFPSPADDFKEQQLSLDERYLSHPEATFMVRVAGSSMEPTLQVGDILIVKSDVVLEDNKIGIVSVNHTDFTVKRLDKKKQHLVADNPAFESIQIQETDTVVCLGVVMHLIRDIK